MYSQIFILPDVQVKAYQEELRRTARDVQVGRMYRGGPTMTDHLLNLTGDVLIRLGTHLKTGHLVSRGFSHPFDPCEGNA